MKTIIVSIVLALGLTDVLASQIKAKHGICLDAAQRSTKGGKVHMYTCDPKNTNQKWTWNASTGQIKATHGICLDASERSKRGGKVHMWTCNTKNPNQQWTYNASTGQIKNRHGICLDASQRSTRGGKVHMWTCDTKNKNQMWTINSECNWQCYLDRYKDLRKAFGDKNTAKAAAHWKTYGEKEGRDCSCGYKVDKLLKESVPHTLDMASLSAQAYYPNRHSKAVIRAGATVTAASTGNKYKITRIIGDHSDSEKSYGKIWFAEFATDKTCALVVRGSYWTSTIVLDNNVLFQGEAEIPGTSYKVLKGYQSHILQILNHDNNNQKLKDWLKSCDSRGYTKIFTGHSLGGAVSTWLSIYFESQPAYRADYVVSFGAPRLVKTFGSNKCPMSLQTRHRAVRIVTVGGAYVDAAALVPPVNDSKEAFCFESMSLDKAGNLLPKDDQWPNWSYNYVTNVFGWPLHDEKLAYTTFIDNAKKKAQANKPCSKAGKICDGLGDWIGVGNCNKRCCHGSEFKTLWLSYVCKPETKPCKPKGSWCDAPGWNTGDCGRCCNRDYGYVWWKLRHECK